MRVRCTYVNCNFDRYSIRSWERITLKNSTISTRSAYIFDRISNDFHDFLFECVRTKRSQFNRVWPFFAFPMSYSMLLQRDHTQQHTSINTSMKFNFFVYVFSPSISKLGAFFSSSSHSSLIFMHVANKTIRELRALKDRLNSLERQ